MLTADHLRRGKEIALRDRNYGARFEGVPFVNAPDAAALAEAGDIVLQYVPQIDTDRDPFHERMLRGMMHISSVTRLSDGRLFRVELLQHGINCIADLFCDLEPTPANLKRYHVVIRSRRLARDPALRAAVNASTLLLAGYEDQDGVPTKERRVLTNFSLRTHRLGEPWYGHLPAKVYCSELAYLAFKVNGIEICPLTTMDELSVRTGGIPRREVVWRTVKAYAMDNVALPPIVFLIVEWERLCRKLGLNFLRLSRYVFRDAAWPCLMFENKEFDVVAAVPPPPRYIDAYERLLGR